MEKVDLAARLRDLEVFLCTAQQSALDRLNPTSAELNEANGINNDARRSQFILGRRCVREAFRQAGCTAEISIPRTHRVAPPWPTNFVGSISHSATLVAAIAARTDHYRALGLDAEYPHRQTGAGLLDRIAAGDERSFGLTSLQLFSIKEACYKAARPLSTKTFAFKTIHLTNPTAMTFHIAANPDKLSGQVIYGENAGHFLAIALISG